MTDRVELIEVGKQALADAWLRGVLLSQDESGGEWHQDFGKFTATVIDAVAPEIARAAREEALREATREVAALSVKAKVGYSDATWVRLDHVTGLLRRKIAAAEGQR